MTSAGQGWAKVGSQRREHEAVRRAIVIITTRCLVHANNRRPASATPACSLGSASLQGVSCSKTLGTTRWFPSPYA